MINSRDIKEEFYVYLHKKADNGEPFYVGKGKGLRAYSAKHRSNWWTNVTTKHGCDVVIIDNNLSEGDAFELEVFLISELGRADLGLGPLVNMTNGGDGISGYKFTEEQRKRLSDTHKGKEYNSPLKKGSDNHMYGVKQSQDTINKRRLSLIGKKRSDIVKEQQSIRMTGTKLSQDTKDKIAKIKCKKVICYTDNGFYKEFDSLSDGASHFNIHITNISCCCLGTRKSAGRHPETKEKLQWRNIDGK